MSRLIFTDPRYWEALERHLKDASGERFAFAHARQINRPTNGTSLEVIDVELIDDDDVHADSSGWSLLDSALDRVHNNAVRGGYGLVEFHNHHRGPAGFSRTDEAGLTPTAAYATQLMAGRPYGAGVYAEGALHVDFWIRNDTELVRETFESVVVHGTHLRVVTERFHPSDRLIRQSSLLGPHGRRTLSNIRIALVGVGGTGAHAAIALAYLGIKRVVLVESDLVELSNLNRLVIADLRDIGQPKLEVAKRRMLAIDPTMEITTLPALAIDATPPELHDVDLIIGCVDHDGPRHRLNELAVQQSIPYIDIATGISSANGHVTVGGRVIVVVPGGPCLHCLEELDHAEIGRWSKDPAQQALDRQHGYGDSGMNASVVHLNGLAVHAAMSEFTAWISGNREPAQFLDIDLSGFLASRAGAPGVRVGPRQPVERVRDCFACGRTASKPPAPVRSLSSTVAIA
jgi:hypothetical protein